jgi:hypothetical protein
MPDDSKQIMAIVLIHLARSRNKSVGAAPLRSRGAQLPATFVLLSQVEGPVLITIERMAMEAVGSVGNRLRALASRRLSKERWATARRQRVTAGRLSIAPALSTAAFDCLGQHDSYCK